MKACNKVILFAALIASGAFACSCNNKAPDASGDADEIPDRQFEQFDPEMDISDSFDPDDDIDDTKEEELYTGTYCGPNCRQVSFKDEVSTYDVWEYMLVYVGNVSGIIYSININTGEETAVANCIDDEYICTDIKICEGFIYYFVRKKEPARRQYDLWRLSIDTGEKEIIHTIRSEDGFGVVSWLDIHGKYLAWIDDRNGEKNRYPYELYLLDLNSGEEIQVTDGNERSVFDIRMWENKIVFAERKGDHEIVLYDIEEDSFTNISNNMYDQYMPAIWENRVVWIDSRTEQSQGVGSYYNPYNPDVYLQHIGGELVAVETEGSLQRYPDVFGDLVVWDDERNDDTPNRFDSHADLRSEVFVYNIITREYKMITESKGQTGGGKPRVWGNRVFYRGRDDNNVLSLFMYEF